MILVTITAGKNVTKEFKVGLFAKSMREEELLVSGETGANGRASLDYAPPAGKNFNLFVRAYAPDGKTVLAESKVHYNAELPLEITLHLPRDVAAKLPSEFETVQTEVAARLPEGESVMKLADGDIAHLAGETGLGKESVAAYVAAAALAKKTGIAVAAVYGLLRHGVKVTDLKSLFNLHAADIRKALTAAVERNVVPATVKRGIGQTVSAIQRLAVTQALNEPGFSGDRSFDDVLAVSGATKRQREAFAERYFAHEGTIAEFWASLKSDAVFKGGSAENLRFAVQADALTVQHAPLTDALVKLRKAGKIAAVSDLAAWSASDWEGLLTKKSGKTSIGAPASVAGKNEKQRAVAYAKSLSRVLQYAYPTEALVGGVIAEGIGTKNKTGLAAFFGNNPDFRFGETTIDAYVKENPESVSGIKGAEAVIEDLKTYQRLFNIVPKFDLTASIGSLAAIGATSAFSVYDMGWSAFSTAFSVAGGSTASAVAIYNQSTTVVAATQALIAKYSPTLNFGPAATRITGYEDAIDGIPELKALFGSLDYCECEHCRSVYSPAAYLTDLLHFLEGVGTGTEDISAFKVLMSRRPDLEQINLNCENALTEMPYVDLVNEILENAIIGLSGDAADVYQASDLQSTLTADELKANPEHQNGSAYDILKAANYPWSLPLDLPTEESRVYLGHLDVKRRAIMDAFFASGDDANLTDDAVAAEWLGLNDGEREVILDASPAKPWEYWGLEKNGPYPDLEDATATVTLSWETALGRVRVFLDQSGLTYEELVELLQTRFVNPDGGIEVVSDCDLDSALFTEMKAATLRKAHRFVRLQKRLGWSFLELDKAMAAFGAEDIDKKFLRQLSHVLRLQEEVKTKLLPMLSWWGDIDTFEDAEDAANKSLYQKLFYNMTVSAEADLEDFKLQASSGDLKSGLTVSGHADAVAGGLGIGAEELAVLTARVVTDDVMDLANLSAMYRVVSMAAALDLEIEEFLNLRDLCGLDPFDASATEAAVKFVRTAKKIDDSGFSVAELDYLLRHQYEETSGVAPTEDGIALFLDGLRSGLASVKNEYAFTAGADPNGDVTRQKLGLILGAEAVEIAGTLLKETPAEDDATDYGAFIEESFAAFMDTTQIAGAKTKLIGGSALTTPADRYDVALEPLLAHLKATYSTEYLKQTFAEELGLDAGVGEDLLTGRIHSTADDSVTAAELFLADAFVDGVDELAWDAHGAYFDTYVRLDKTARLLNGFEIAGEELPYHFDDGPDGAYAGWQAWVDFDVLPVETNALDTVADKTALAGLFSGWERLHDLTAFRDALPESETGIYEVFLDAFTSSSTLSEDVASMTEWSSEDIASLMAAFGYASGDLKDEKPFVRMSTCFALLKTLGVSAEQAGAWTGAEVAAEGASAAKAAAKAKYDDEKWLEVAKPLRDELREKQRSALVDYLIANQDDIEDADDLYAYYLIDVEMQPCMITSRIVAANGSVQQFIQRCLMNLEGAVKIQALDLETWKQWTWMKNYRVWEANRKIFLYPENWADPELRDDKSPFYEELEKELLQTDVNSDTVERAYLRYLEKLQAVAHLDVRATCLEEGTEDGDVLHVVARTPNSPHVYYYRTQVDGRYWTPWRPMDLDIEGDHLLLAVFNRKLHAYWPTFEERAETPSTSEENQGDSVKKFWWIRMASSAFYGGAWSPKTVSVGYVENPDPAVSTPPKDNYFFRASEEGGEMRLTAFYGYSYGYNEETFDLTQVTMTSVGVFRYLPQGAVTAEDHTYEEEQETVTFSTPTRAALEYQQFTEYASASAEPLGVDGQTLLTKTPDDRLTTTHLFQEATSFYARGKVDAFEVFFMREGNRNFFVTRSGSPSIKLMVVGGTDGTASGMSTNGKARSSNRFGYDHMITDTKQVQDPGAGDYCYAFHAFYHPYVTEFVKAINMYGIEGLLNPSASDETAALARQGLRDETDFFDTEYDPTSAVDTTYPTEEIDFSYEGAYASYNWELFYHIPVLIATRLMQNQKFEEAQDWFHYIFDPTNADTNVLTPARYWKTKPFYEVYGEDEDGMPASITELMEALSGDDPEMLAQVEEWKADPFNPHLVARMRITAYQKYVTMKYLDNLVAWGDQLFRQDTMESVNEATQLYVLASQILGKAPEELPGKETEDYAYAQLAEEGLDAFSNAMVAVEDAASSVVSSSSSAWATEETTETVPEASLSVSNTLYFCIPQNDTLLAYWDTVADRLYKIRHCQNIEGVARSLSLFAPPIDPGLLAKAAAAGVDLSSALSDLYAPLPYYRFEAMHRKALEFAGDVKVLGGALLSALEKQDSEELTLIRAGHEKSMLEAVKDIKEQQIEEAEAQIESLKNSLSSAEKRNAYYADIEKVSDKEQENLDKLESAHKKQTAAQIMEYAAAFGHLLPEFDLGASGFAGSPVVKARWGGTNLGEMLRAGAGALNILAAVDNHKANMASIKAGHERRWNDWKLQEDVTGFELEQIGKQIVAAEVRLAIAEADLKNHEKQMAHAEEVEAFLTSKYTNQELYSWMVTQISTVYFQSYQLAYDLAKKAEKCFQYERSSETSYLSYGYWDSLKKGLLAGEKLTYDLRRMETAYMDQNKRDYEIAKNVSLAAFDPSALLALRETGECSVDLPEALFDIDFPGQYLRRIKSVSLSIPCVVGPYTGVNCKLTLLSSSIRVSNSASDDYVRDPAADDSRFKDDYSSVQSVAVSHGQNDAGVFELNFRDERYLPFEGAGAIGSWRLELPTAFKSFDYGTISDVVFHLRYTAKEGGESLKESAETALASYAEAVADGETNLSRMFSIRYEFPDEWNRFLNPATEGADHALSLEIVKERFPYMFQDKTLEAQRVEFLLRASVPGAVTIACTPPGGSGADVDLATSSELGGQAYASQLTTFDIEDDADPLALTVAAGDLEDLGDVQDLILIVHYTAE